MRSALLPSFAVSILLNTAMFAAFDRTFEPGPARLQRLRMEAMQKDQRSRLQLEFVESPKTPAPKPAEARRISDRNAQSRDLSGNVANPENAPKMDTIGPADQLAQRRQTGASQPVQRTEDRGQKTEDKERAATDKEQKTGDAGQEAGEQAVKDTDQKQNETIQQLVSPSSVFRPPSSESGGIVARDKITTQAMAKAPSRGAGLSGVVSFEATGSGMGEYMKNLKERIWLAWFPYLAFKYPLDFHTADAVIRMTIDAKGEVKSVQVLQSSGSEIFAAFCTDAVQRASGFGPLPEEILALIGKDELEIKFAFHYR